MATRPPPSSGQPTRPDAAVDATLRKDDRVTARVPDGEDMRVEDRRSRRVGGEDGGGPLVLDRYRLHRRLGTGGFGTVWHARDERLERDVAVKLLPRERVVSGRFEREARAAARLSHPGIVTLYEAAVDDDGAYLVSELVVGATLSALLDAGRLSDRDILKIASALSAALIHAHAQGVVHRDVKPSNVLIPERPATPAQIAKLTDFGVARIIGGDALTRTGDVIGTMAYMAPEQAEGLEAGASADLYSLALVIYEALTGVNPVGTGTAARRARRLGAYLPPLRRQRRDLPRELGCAVDLALRPRPRERGSVEELGAAFESSLGNVHDRPGVIASPWPSRTERSLGARPPLEDRHAEPFAEPARAQPLRLDEGGEPEPRARRPPIPWPQRALSGAVAAGAAAWLAGTVLPASGVNPAIVAAVAGAVVALLPRIGWIALVATAVAALAADSRPGAAVLVAIGGLITPLLLPLRPARWPLPAVAPALGAIGLAGAWPALAGRAGSAWQRAALGGAGWILLVIVEALGATNLYAHLPHAVPARSAWMPSVSGAVDHVLGPLLSSGLLAPALVWAFAAVVLPWATAIRSLPVTIVLVTAWAAATASATTTVLHAAHAGVTVRGDAAVLGAVAAAVVALAPPIAASFPASRRPDNTPAGLA
ncbi:MAG TPA: serine/threonine-protein kinase [Solirubrobacteraceae bacterium]|jgi:serine/threonine protein kinase